MLCCGKIRVWRCKEIIKLVVLSTFLLPAYSFALTMDFTFTGTVPAELQTAVEYAGGLWESWLLNTASGESEDVEITISYEDLGPDVLGSAGSTYVWGPLSDPLAYVPSMGAILKGMSDTDDEDGTISFSNRYSWYYGTDGNPGGSEYDAATVALHEIGHQVGFYDSYYNNKWGFNFGGGDWRLLYWDTFLRDNEGDAPVAGGGDSFDETANPVYFTGTHAIAANGGMNVPIYAPSLFDPGSSLSHLDEQNPYWNYLMSYSIGTGEAMHELSDVEVAMLRDLGWQAVPEPSTLFLLGLGAVMLKKKLKFF